MAYFIAIALLCALLALFVALTAAGETSLAKAWSNGERSRAAAARLWRRLKASAGRHYLTAFILTGSAVFL